jgi:LysM repeat protein
VCMMATINNRVWVAAAVLALLLAAPAWQAAHADDVIHTVQPGETLYRIGLQHGVSWVAIMRANHLTRSTIYPGQQLIIPVKGAAPADTPTEPASEATPTPEAEAPPAESGGTTTYVVQRGDSLSRIAQRFGVTTAQLAAANNIANPSRIYVGQTLTIPAPGAAPAAAPAPSDAARSVLVDISEQRMYVYENGALINTFVVSTGEPGRETAPGSYSVLNKIPLAYASTWDLRMPNWLGIYWAGSLQNGIHELPILSNGQRLWAGYLGSRVSYGCVILGSWEAQWLFDWVDVGTPVIIQN